MAPGESAIPAALAEDPDRARWNERYRASTPEFTPHPLVAEARSAGIPVGGVLELACGPSGSALALAAAGHEVTAVDIAEVALGQLQAEAARRGLARRIRCVLADAAGYEPDEGGFGLVAAFAFWDAAAFTTACAAVAPGGLLAWQALAEAEGKQRFRVAPGELGARLPEGFVVLAEQEYIPGRAPSTSVLARRAPGAGTA